MALALLLLLTFTPTAAAKPAFSSVDHSFGKRGTISRGIARGYQDPRAKFAVAPSGKIVLATIKTVVRYRRDGKLDRSFGENGEVAIKGLPGTNFRLAGVVVDSRGRILVAGTAIDPSHIIPGPQYGSRLEAEFGVILRYTTAGKPDLSFGSDGVLSSTFGRPPPTVTLGNPPSTFQYESPTVMLAGIAVDANDRPLLTGLGVKKMSGCRGSFYGSQRVFEGFAARLTTAGQPDLPFGESGVRPIEALRQVNEPLLDPKGDGVVFTGGLLDGCPAESGLSAVAHLSQGGAPDQTFGPEGWKGFENTEGGIEAHRGSPAAVDDQGRILLLRTDEDGLNAEVARLRPNGGFDNSFGDRGITRVPPAAIAHITTIAVDARGRVLLAGWHGREPCTRCGRGGDQRLRKTFVLLRLRPNGKIDPRFSGRKGLIASFPGFAATTSAVARQILLDRRGHILVGGSIVSNRFSTGLGAGLIRYRAQR